MHVFTSITANYLPKARVLATSLKRFHPQAAFHLVLSDRRPDDLGERPEPFDSVLTLEELPIPSPRAWAFKHSVVELCTAVKAAAAGEILRRHGAEHLYYLDPDIAVLGPLDGLEALLGRHSILLTPHLTVPEEDLAAVLDNEICTLKHGIYNLGFVGVRADEEGRRFLAWWAERLLHFCYDDIPGGLFTDQRWADLAPAFFPGVAIVREPQYNVATWNLTHRRATGRAPYDIRINGQPLAFFHFSGFDSGAQEIMLKRYGTDSPVLFELRDWYLAECERLGQADDGKRPCVYGFFDDGTPVTRAQRLLYRQRPDVQQAFPDPYATADPNRSFLHWYRADTAAAAAVEQARRAHDAQRVLVLQAELDAIRSSRAWQATQALSLLRRALTRPGHVLGWMRRGLRVCRQQGVGTAFHKLRSRLRGPESGQRSAA